MNGIDRIVFGAVLFGVLVAPCTGVLADEPTFEENNRSGLPVFFTSAYSNEFGWRETEPDFSIVSPVSAVAGSAPVLSLTSKPVRGGVAGGQAFKPSKDDAFFDGFLEDMPYKHEMKATWKLIDGKTDLYVEGLRVNRRNRGVSYTIHSLPLVGEMEDSALRAEFGQRDRALKFESRHVPFVGSVEGLSFSSSAGNSGAQVSLRFKRELP
ncbi:MAG: hypothetical protein KDI46_06710 [Alphaproteobacteria bacterium]|nr:hypothetical protein [Alphaproteobacteria bacterium]